MRTKSRFSFFLFCFVIGQIFTLAQFTIIGNNKGWLPVSSGNGSVFRNIIDLQLHMNGNNSYNYSRWSIIGRVTSPIVNSDNMTFPVERMKFRYGSNRVTGIFEVTNPTGNQMGVIESNIEMSYNSIFFVHNSPFDINVPRGKYGGIVLQYDVLIDAGAYLRNLVSWKNYRIEFEFSILDELGRVVSTTRFPIEMQISPNGTYIDEIPTVSIQMENEAKNAEISFITPNDYLNGVTKIYDNAITIEANTSYEVTVSALDTRLRSSDAEMDLDLIKIQLKNSISNQFFDKESLSITPKRLAIGSSTMTTPHKYSIIYSALPSQQLFNTTTGFYTIPLLYTVSPL